jgi:hypothetical protein
MTDRTSVRLGHPSAEPAAGGRPDRAESCVGRTAAADLVQEVRGAHEMDAAQSGLGAYVLQVHIRPARCASGTQRGRLS